MPRARLRLFATAALALLLALIAEPARAAFQTPVPLDGHVVDTAHVLSAAEILALDQKLEALRVRSGFEVVAFVVGSLEGEDIADVAHQAFNTWKLGQEGQDNGVLLVIAPSERRVRIETGKGVGGALTDLQSNDIIRNRISPLLVQDRVRDAIDDGTTAIAEALQAGGAPGKEPRPQPAWRAIPNLVWLALLALVVVLAIVSPGFRAVLLYAILFGRGRGGGGGGGGSGFGGGGGASGGGGSSDSYRVAVST